MVLTGCVCVCVCVCVCEGGEVVWYHFHHTFRGHRSVEFSRFGSWVVMKVNIYLERERERTTFTFIVYLQTKEYCKSNHHTLCSVDVTTTYFYC